MSKWRGKFLQNILQSPFRFTCLAGTILFFLFFRAGYALTGNYVSFHLFSDDATYVHYLILLSDAFGITSGIQDSWLDAARQYSGPHPPGIAVAWLPAALVAGALHFLGGFPYGDLLAALIGALNWLYYCLALYLFLKCVKSVLSPENAFAVFLTIPVLYYASHRTTMTHPAETVLLILFFHSLAQAGASRKAILLQLLILCFVSSIRYQYFVTIPFYCFFLISQKTIRRNGSSGLLFPGWGYAVLLLSIGLGVYLAYLFWPSEYFSQTRLKQMMTFHLVSFRWLYSWLIPLIDPSWGILFLSGGACLLIFKSIQNGIRNRTLWQWKQKFLLAWILLLYIIAVSVGKHGDDVQYRFLIPLIVSAPFCMMMFRVESFEKVKLFRIVNTVSCGLTLLIVWLAKTREAYTLTYHKTNFWMAEGWHHFWLIPDAIFGVVTNPSHLASPLFLSPLWTVFATARPHESQNPYAVPPIPFGILVVMILLHLGASLWAVRRAIRKEPDLS